MKPYYTIVLFSVVACLVGCIHFSSNPSAIQQAESIMNTRPDSALKMLQELEDSISIYPEETQMYWHLLTIQAKDKQYIVHTSDSLINSIVEFYERYGDKEKLMMAYYYQGSVYRDMNDAPRALKCFQKAIEINIPYNDLPIKAYNQMGNLFMYQGLHDEAIKVNRNAIKLYIQQGKENKTSYAWRDIARMYKAKGQQDSASFYYKHACQIALADKDSARFYGMLGEIGGYYCQLGKNDSAKLILKYAERQPLIRNKRHIHAMLGNVYKVENNLDSACYYYWKTIEYGDIRNTYYSYKNLYDAEVQRGNYRQAAIYIDKALTLKDSIDQITQTEAIAKINSLYNYQHTEAENARLQLEQEKQKALITILTLGAIGLILGGILFFTKQKAKRLKVEQAMENFRKEAKERYERSEKAIRDNEKEIEKLQLKLEKTTEERDLLQIQQKRLQAKNQAIALQQEETKLRIEALRRTTIYKDFQQASKDEKINLQNEQSISKWEALKEAIDTAYPDFTGRIQLLCPSLSDREIKVCLLTKADIAPSGIAIVLKCSRQAITNIRMRLFKKVTDYNNDFKDFDHFIESL